MNLSDREITEQMLAMPRQKRVGIATSIAYRAARVCDAVVGKRRMLGFFLDASRLMSRFAFERSGEIYDHDFHDRAKALSPDILSRWIDKDRSVIDIGCGPGRWSLLASKYAKSVVGIDHSPDLIAAARIRCDVENVEFIVGDCTRDLADRKFDVALLIHVIEHIDEADAILLSIRKIARTLIVEVPDIEGDPLNLVRLSLERPFDSDGDHVREYTEAILNAQLQRTGWRVLENRKNGGAVLAVATRDDS